MDQDQKVLCGIDFPVGKNLQLDLFYAARNGCDFICVPIVHPRYKKELEGIKTLSKISRCDMELSVPQWEKVVGKVSSWINTDSPDPNFRKQSEEALMRELDFAAYVELQAALLELDGSPSTNLARIIHNQIIPKRKFESLEVWCMVPMKNSKESNAISSSKSGEEIPANTWTWWNNLRLMCNSEAKLGVALKVSNILPSIKEIDRWFGEPLKMVVLDTSMFTTDINGFPALGIPHRSFLMKCARFNLKVLLTGNNEHGALKEYVDYLNKFYKIYPIISPDHEDNLYLPLQPLHYNITSTSYAMFERDKYKYIEYEYAIALALEERAAEGESGTNYQVVMILGAGRGPLVTAALSAAASTNQEIKCYAVEKNPGALVTLYTLKEEMWGNRVEVVGSDMRYWSPPEKCDIMVSELLGCFGDNELSPECLYGAQKCLKDDGISIPSEYSSYICPIQSQKLYNQVRSFDDQPCKSKFEVAYNGIQLNLYAISDPQKLFTFTHPNKDAVIDNTRYKTLKFISRKDSVLYGFSGYFEAILYDHLKLSTIPGTLCYGDNSWAPMYFPIKEPVKLRKGDELVVHFWRLSDSTRVWYEWCISKPVILPIHNPNGTSSSVGSI